MGHGEMERSHKLVHVRAAHGRSEQVSSQHAAHQRLPCPRGAMEGQNQGPIGVFILKKLYHFLRHDVLNQVLPKDVFVDVPFQVCSAPTKTQLAHMY